MEKEFWLNRWDKNEIGFHQDKTHPFLVKYFNKLGLAPGGRIFMPLCGKTLDLIWGASHGFKVVGIEIAQKAVEQFFMENNLQPTISKMGHLILYKAGEIEVFLGDFFELTDDLLGKVDAVYDRASLVALPPKIRDRYVEHLLINTQKAPQLLITFEYDQNLMDGPPFSIDAQEVNRYYKNEFKLSLLETIDVPGGLRGKFPGKENIWFLSKN